MKFIKTVDSPIVNLDLVGAIVTIEHESSADIRFDFPMMPSVFWKFGSIQERDEYYKYIVRVWSSVIKIDIE